MCGYGEKSEIQQEVCKLWNDMNDIGHIRNYYKGHPATVIRMFN